MTGDLSWEKQLSPNRQVNWFQGCLPKRFYEKKNEVIENAHLPADSMTQLFVTDEQCPSLDLSEFPVRTRYCAFSAKRNSRFSEKCLIDDHRHSSPLHFHLFSLCTEWKVEDEWREELTKTCGGMGGRGRRGRKNEVDLKLFYFLSSPKWAAVRRGRPVREYMLWWRSKKEMLYVREKRPGVICTSFLSGRQM